MLTPAQILATPNNVYCGVGNGTVKNLVYTHPADKQCNYSVDTSNFVTKDEIEEPLTIKMYNESLLTDNEIQATAILLKYYGMTIIL